jgi:cyclase
MLVMGTIDLSLEGIVMRTRKRLLVAIAGALCFWIAAAAVAAQAPAPGQSGAAPGAPGPGGPPPGPRGLPQVVHQLTDSVYWVFGPSTSNNSNNGIIVGRDGVILFDTKNTIEDEKSLLAQVAKITDKPVTTVILSHSDGDHTNGLPVLPKGVTIIAQDYCKMTMDASAGRGGRGAADPDYLPTKSFDKKESLTVNGVRLELLHFAPAHTGGDTILYLPQQKIVFMGDVVLTEQPDPVMHMDNGGSPQGIDESIKGMIALDSNTYVSGHGPVATKLELQRRLATYEDKIAKVKALLAQGKSLPEIQEALGEPVPPPAPAGGRGPGLGSFTSNIYIELTRK